MTALRKGRTIISSGIGFPREACVVTVVDPTIKVNKKEAVIYSYPSDSTETAGKSVTLKATVKGAEKNVTWSSDNENIAAVTVDAQGRGVVTAARQAGTAVITAEANGKKASCKVTVLESAISLNMNEIKLSTKGAGSSIKLTPAIVGAKKQVTWTSSDPAVAAVKGGKVTGKWNGDEAKEAVITARANGVTAECRVIVDKGMVSINEEKILLYVKKGNTETQGETKELKTNAPQGSQVIWSSDNEAAATVSNTGLVTAKGAGVAVITAECNGKKDTCKVEVKNTSASIAERVVHLKTKGNAKTYKLAYQVTGRKTTAGWKSSNTKLAAYDWYGGEDLSLNAGEVKEAAYKFTVDKETDNNITFVISMGQIKAGEELVDTPVSAIEIDDISVIKVKNGDGSGEEVPPTDIGTELIRNGNFAAGEENWSHYVDSAAKAETLFEGGKARYEITNAGTADWNIQLKQEGLAMEKGVSYKVNFKIGASIDRDLKLAFMGAGDAWHGGTDISLKKDKLLSVSRIVKLEDKDIAGTLAFQLSLGETGTEQEGTTEKLAAHAVEISDISVIKVEAGTEADPETETETTITPPVESSDPGDDGRNEGDGGTTDDSVGNGSDGDTTGDNIGNGGDSDTTDDSVGDGIDSGTTDDSVGDGTDSGTTDDSVGDGIDSGTTDDSVGDGTDSGTTDDSVGDGTDSGTTDDNGENGSDDGTTDNHDENEADIDITDHAI